VDFPPGVEGNVSAEKQPFKKGDQVSWRGKIAKITSDVIEIEGIVCDLRIECDDGEVLSVFHSELLSAQLGINELDRSTSVALSSNIGVSQPVGKLDAEGVAEVLKCVGPNDTPRNLYREEFREELRNDINAALDFYHGFEAESSKGRRTQKRSYAEELGNALQKLSDVLDQRDPVATSLQKRIFHRTDLSEFRVQLHGLVQRCQVLSNTSNASSMSDVIRVSALYLFLGDSLASIFERHFKQSAKRTRNADGQLDSPFVRFAMAVAAATRLGCVGRETVSKALTKVAQVRHELE
jgi:hypothetical protein